MRWTQWDDARFCSSFLCAFVHCQVLRFLTRAGPGGGVLTPPGPQCRAAHVNMFSFLLHLLIHLFCTCLKFIPRSLKVRSPGHVKWRYLRKSLNVCHRYTKWLIVLKLSVIDMNNNMYKMCILIFDFHDRRSGQLSELSIIGQLEKIEKRLLWINIILKTLKHLASGHLGTLNRTIATSDSFGCSRGHLRSWKVPSSFSTIGFAHSMLDRRKWLRCVQVDDMGLLTSNMIFLGKVMILTMGKASRWPFNTRTGGGLDSAHPPLFFANNLKRRSAASPNLTYLRHFKNTPCVQILTS